MLCTLELPITVSFKEHVYLKAAAWVGVILNHTHARAHVRTEKEREPVKEEFQLYKSPFFELFETGPC